MSNRPPKWHPDPTERFALRYWDGEQWTEHVSNEGVVTTDPLITVHSDKPGEADSLEISPNDVVPPIPAQAATVAGDILAATDALRRHVEDLRAEVERLSVERDRLQESVVEVRDEVLLQELGIYKVRHVLEDSPAYQSALDEIRWQLRSLEKGGEAFVSTEGWTVNGSLIEGAKMVSEIGKLMLRAYNSDVENAIRTLKPYRLDASIKRINKTRETIARLASAMKIEIAADYHALRIRELELTSDYLVKRAEEKEWQRALREQQREEERAQAEIRREQQKLEKERAHRANVLAQLVKSGAEAAEIADAEAKLSDIDGDIEGLAQRAANTRAGYVYIISNHGAFGEKVVKIGMTRRLEPMDRVLELGDASVPFRFDVHMLLFSEDAVALEAALHERFASHRVNLINLRREFFYVTPREVRAALEEMDVTLLEFIEDAEAFEYRQSESARVPAGEGGLV